MDREVYDFLSQQYVRACLLLFLLKKFHRCHQKTIVSLVRIGNAGFCHQHCVHTKAVGPYRGGPIRVSACRIQRTPGRIRAGALYVGIGALSGNTMSL
jgi:hypothetical protein